jgi:NADH:ubiquinone oxidoreductase subunit 3 (subunit A)
MFTSVLVVPDVGTVSLYLWAISSSIQGISVFIRASILVLIFIVGSVAKRNIGMFLSFRVFRGGGEGGGKYKMT